MILLTKIKISMLVLGVHRKDRTSTKDKANIRNPKVNRGCPPLTSNRTSADCVQISLGPPMQYIPLRVLYWGFNAMFFRGCVSERVVSSYSVSYSQSLVSGSMYSLCQVPPHKRGRINFWLPPFRLNRRSSWTGAGLCHHYWVGYRVGWNLFPSILHRIWCMP